MNVLIFGGTGLLGSAAAQIFIDRGHKVKTIALPPLPEGAPIPEEMEIESFIHGAMCISYSGRCLLSNYFTGRGNDRR